MMVEIATAGTTIRIELMKKGLRPVGWTPICAVDQADSQGSIVQTFGRLSMPPWRISSSGFSEFTTIT
ncbi:hypothetical protein D3C72_2535740 [compost metagenome]